MHFSQVGRATLAAALISGGLVASAQASTFSFTETGTGISASGEIFATDQGGGSFLITSIVGTLNGDAISLIAPGGYQGNDNELEYPPNPYPYYVTFAGWSFEANGVDYNLYDNSAGGYGCAVGVCSSTDPNGPDTAITLTVAQTPLPSTWAMMVTGFIGLGFFVYRRTNNRSAIATA